jgi:hypothetical protein
VTIELSDKEQKTLAHLRKCADNQTFNINEIKTFLDGLEQKISAPPSGKKERKNRKRVYLMKIQNHIHGNKKIV